MLKTVNGVVSAENIKNTLAHEHFVFGKPGLLGEEDNCYQRETAFENGLKMLKMTEEYEVDLVVDVTTAEWGRDPYLLKRISDKTKCHIICSTGFFKDEGDMLAYLKAVSYSEDLKKWLHKLFVKEIEEGIGKSGIKAGAVKTASSLGRIRPLEKVIFQAATATQKDTGVPIFTHCDRGTMGVEQAELLKELGADPEKVVIGHMSSNHDTAEMMRIMDRGYRIGFDQFGILSIPGIPNDEQKSENLLELLKRGYEDSIVLSHDCVFDRMGYVSASKPRYPDMIFKKVNPYLKENGISDKAVKKLTRNNLLKVFGEKV